MSKMGFLKEHEWLLTKDGKTLSRIFHESDLLVVEALRSGLFDGLSAAELAGLVSAIVYEYRGIDEPPPPWFPTRELQARFRRLESISLQIDTIEGEFGLAVHRPPRRRLLALPLPTGGVQELSSLTLLTMVILREVTSFETSGK